MKILHYLAFFACLSLIACKANKDAVSENGVEEEQSKALAQNTGYAYKVIVNLKPEYRPEDLELEFAQYGLKSQRRTNKTLNAWLFDFNGESVRKKRLLSLLNKHEYIIRAEGINGPKPGSAELSKSAPKKKVKLPIK